jgi:DUF1365 family protein
MTSIADLSCGYASHCATAPAVIRHRRFKPKSHQFYATLNYLWFDPERIESTCQYSTLWSFQRWNILSIQPSDFMPQFAGSFREKISQHLQQDAAYTLQASDQIRILALPRSFGYGFNSVIFYFVWASNELRFILSEITNTPWNERHIYTHDCLAITPKLRATSLSYAFEFAKRFHVSPFMPMDIGYQWNFSFMSSGYASHPHDSKSKVDSVFIEMRLLQNEKMLFDASMHCHLIPMNSGMQQARYALGFPLQGVKMLTMIYIQAVKLWLKKIPFYPHPRKRLDHLSEGDKSL